MSYITIHYAYSVLFMKCIRHLYPLKTQERRSTENYVTKYLFGVIFANQ